MQKALLSALTGLRINQQYLDVIGNNLANTSTPGYKSSRVTFAELLGQTLIPASGPTANFGGRNPSQVGSGAAIRSIDRNFAQGSLLRTGRDLDLGIEGDGFFIVSNGGQEYYTRVGSFGLDADEYMVDLRSGYRLRNVLGQDVRVQLNSVIPAERTSAVDFQGNLPGVRNGPTAEKLATDRAFMDHQAALVTAAAPGAGGNYPVSVGEQLIVRVNGTNQTVTVLPTDLATPNMGTPAEVAAIISRIPGVVGSVNGSNVVEMRSTATGPAATLFIPGGPSNPLATTLFSASIGSTITGAESTAVLTTNLNDLSANTRDYNPGDRIVIAGNLLDGTPVTGEFVYGDPSVDPSYTGTDLGSLVTLINTVFQSTDLVNGATATFDPAGTITLDANASGDVNLAINISDVPSGPTSTPAGQTNWGNHFFKTTRQGKDPDTADVVSTVYDSQGQSHALTLSFERQEDSTWNLTASLDASEGQVLSQVIMGIGFDQDGLLNQVPPSLIEISWEGVPGTQTINLNLGSAGETEGLTQFGLAESVVGIGNGYTAGSLSNVSIRSDGTIEGFYTNGQFQDLDQIALALFKNPAGLNAVGGSLWQSSSNSGQPVLLAAQSGAAGSINAGSLEASNVDIAEEFVRLIEAQRSFQANARVVTTTNEVLAELVNLVR